MLKEYFYFHGTIKRFGEYIKRNGIDISISRPNTDFGRGFYITNNLEQATNWAKLKQQDYTNIYSLEDIKPVVVYFILDTDKLSYLNGIHFDHPNLIWSNFILECREKGLHGEIYHNNDFTSGPLADGKIMPLLRRAINGKIDNIDFLNGIKPRFPGNTQLSLHSHESLKCITCLEVKEIE